MKVHSVEELSAFFRSLESEYDVRIPVALHDGTRGLGRPDEGKLALFGGKLPRKPTSVFFPQHAREFRYDRGKVEMEPPPSKPLFVVGFTAADAECLEFIDRFFRQNTPDDIYFARRGGSVVVVVSGKCGADGTLLRLAGGRCDVELVSDGKDFVAAPCSEVGRKLCGKIPGGREAGAVLDALQKESDNLPNGDRKTLERASDLIRGNRVPDEFWADVGDRCIACLGCIYSCPTCTCFEVYDRGGEESGDRDRMWDACLLDGFMREASGHNPMGKEWVRTRRRIHHKLAADVERWGTKSCYLCGRCDEVCPTGIGIVAVSREIVSRYG